MRNLSPQNLSLSVTVRDRSGLLFEGQAEAATSYNTKGEFDVLPLHANFITLVNRILVLRFGGNVTRTIALETGVLTVHKDKSRFIWE